MCAAIPNDRLCVACTPGNFVEVIFPLLGTSPAQT
jgi:hypothetical protein